MIHYSVLIPERDAGQELARQIPQVNAALARLSRPYEIVCIDDGSAPPTQATLELLSRQFSQFRVIQQRRADGLSLALAAGIAAAQGEVVVTMEAGPQYSAEQIALLVSYLSRADLVFGHRRCGRLAKAWQRVARIPRWLVWGLDVRDPACLFWAARHEAVAGIQLSRGMYRHLPLLVRNRGYRVGETYVKHQRGGRALADGWCNPVQLWSSLRQGRRPELGRAQEPVTRRQQAA